MFRITSAMVRKRIGHPTKPATESTDQPPPAVANVEVEELPTDIFTKPIEITKSKHLLVSESSNEIFYFEN